MSQKNDTPVLIISLFITLALLGGGAWLLFQRMGNQPSLPGSGSPGSPSTPTSGTGNNPGTSAPGNLAERFSAGDRLLVGPLASTEKELATRAIAEGNYAEAVSQLETVLQANRNDPEALIYLNNARIGTGQAYTIAVSVPLITSLNPALEILRGVAQAQTEINQMGGINGIPLKVMIVSDDNEPTMCQQVAEQLVQDSSVLAVVGHFGSDCTLAAAPVYQRGNLVMVSPTSTSVELSEWQDYVFRTVPSDRFTATTLSRYMVNTMGRQNAAVFFNSESNYSNSLNNEFTTSIYGDGGQIVAEFDLANGGFNAAAAVQQAIQQGADTLVLLSNTPTLDAALQVVLANNGQLALLGGDSLYNPQLLQVGGTLANGMVVAVPWHVLSNSQSQFVQNSRQLWGGDVNWRTAMAYDATIALIEGLRRNPNRAGLEQALSSPDFSAQGATGTLRFLPSGDRNQAMQLVEVQPGNRSGYGYDFVPVP
jgi:branched-chain amino acid transport system substrate-binding protein